jgi:hypothetical protein
VRPAGSARYRPSVDSDGNERARKSGPDVRSRRATVQAGQAIVELQRVIGFDRRPRRPRDVEPRPSLGCGWLRNEKSLCIRSRCNRQHGSTTRRVRA